MIALTPDAVLRLLPRRPPIRFIDEILELDGEHIVSKYTWKEEDCAGHFPGNPVVPGVKMIEMAVQTSTVAWGIYLMGRKEVGMVSLCTHIDKGSFKKMVRPGDTSACRARFGARGCFAGGKLVAEAEITFSGGPQNGETAFTGVTAGLWLPKDAEQLL